MASQSKGKSSKTVIERPGINWRDEGSSLILSVLKEAATVAELKKAASTALLIFETTQLIKENKEACERLGYDSSGLIIAIWRSFKEAEDSEKWLSADMRDILEDLLHTLEAICSFLNGQLSKNKAIRVIFSRADGVKINEYHEHLNYAMQKFELQSHMKINDVLIRVLKKDDQISEPILPRNEKEVNHALEIRARDTRDQVIAQEQEWETRISKLERLKQVEINRQTEDERRNSDELKKIEKETEDRKSELERLRETAWALEEANRLRQAEEEEIAQLRRTLAADSEEANRRSNKIRARWSKKKSSRQEGEEKDEEWNGNFVIEEASEVEEEELVRRSSKVKRSASGSSKRPPVALKLDSTDDDEEDLQSCSRLRTARRKLSTASLPEEVSQSMRSAKTRMARPSRNLSSASLRVQESEDDYTDKEDDCPKGKRKSQTCNVDDSMAQSQDSEFTPMGLGSPKRTRSGSNSRSRSPVYMPPRPYGYAGPRMVINAGVGNVTNTTIENVGNDNSLSC